MLLIRKYVWKNIGFLWRKMHISSPVWILPFKQISVYRGWVENARLVARQSKAVYLRALDWDRLSINDMPLHLQTDTDIYADDTATNTAKKFEMAEPNIGTKHDFPFINIRKVPREVLKTECEVRGFQHLPRDLANVNEWQNHVWLLLLHKSNENTAKMEKIIAHFILQPYNSLALFTYSHVLFFYKYARFGPWSSSHD